MTFRNVPKQIFAENNPFNLPIFSTLIKPIEKISEEVLNSYEFESDH